MADMDKVIKGLSIHGDFGEGCNGCPYFNKIDPFEGCVIGLCEDAIELLEEQKTVKQKMWNALYAEEDRLEKKYVGTDNHDDWFFVFRPWLQRGFEIALKVFTNQEG